MQAMLNNDYARRLGTIINPMFRIQETTKARSNVDEQKKEVQWGYCFDYQPTFILLQLPTTQEQLIHIQDLLLHKRFHFAVEHFHIHQDHMPPDNYHDRLF